MIIEKKKVHWIEDKSGHRSKHIPWGFLCSGGIGSRLYGKYGYQQWACQQDTQSCHRPCISGLFLQMPSFQFSLNLSVSVSPGFWVSLEEPVRAKGKENRWGEDKETQGVRNVSCWEGNAEPKSRIVDN